MRTDHDYRPREEQNRDQTAYWVAGVVVVAIIVAYGWYRWAGSDEKQEVEVTVQTPSAAPAQTPPAPPEIRHPVPEPAAAEPLPALDESDTAFADALTQGWGPDAVAQFLMPEGAIRRIVATVDNLPREKIANQIRATRPIAGNFTVQGQDREMKLAADNSARYAPFIKLLESTDANRMAEVYFRFYPLFQQAYAELGFPDRHFNDRLVEVIDHLLETPDVPESVALVRPRVFYEYADPELESRSAGQKSLMRLGRENALIVKKKLYEIRQAITAQTPG